MHNLFFLSVLLFATPVLAAETVRCGTDDFGNTVCMDRNGVLTTAPKKTADAQEREDAQKGSAKDESGTRQRCGIDQFGNTVCSPFAGRSMK